MSAHNPNWKCHPQAEKLLLKTVEDFSNRNPFIAHLQQELIRQTSTRLFDWIDHLRLSYSNLFEDELLATGYIIESASTHYRIYHHPGAQFPAVVLDDANGTKEGIALSVETIADFLMVRGLKKEIEGSLLSGYRKCEVSNQQNVVLWVVERRGVRTFEPMITDAKEIEQYLKAKEKWQTRTRGLDNEKESMREALDLAEELAESLGPNRAAWVVLECERAYWQARNHAGQLQKNRQDRLGMGWANHDHHTFRSSRNNFTALVRLFEILGFHCRERFYAGEEAGWGAQVMENPQTRLVLFLDVDLSPEEIGVDFAHQPLPALSKLGTIGLWCALHGESILKAGMHHLEAQFMFDELANDLAGLGVGMMDPFSSFPFLKQAFTAGEPWHVEPQRIELLLKKGLITKEQAEKFHLYGAVGSHLENLQRREGYKGFNQKNVSFIIKKTDPRSY
jgi:hypothetical protein